jgi:ribonucleoside-triphosphate reductase
LAVIPRIKTRAYQGTLKLRNFKKSTTMPLPTDYQNFIAISRYARWRDEFNRRETWEETVSRFIENVVRKKLPSTKYDNLIKSLEEGIASLKEVPSMRALMTAGPALERDNTCIYNCAYGTADRVDIFHWTLAVLANGTGMGFSVESHYVEKLPIVPNLKRSGHTIIVEDSKEGWARALNNLVSGLYSGYVHDWDTRLVRPAGAKLKTFGGRASGPEPLESLFKFVVLVFKKSQGRRLKPIEVHDILCKIAEVIVVGGVRRSAMISLSDLSDEAMAKAKGYFKVNEVEEISDSVLEITTFNQDLPYDGVPLRIKVSGEYERNEILNEKKIGWWHVAGQRALANNSAVYVEKPSKELFDKEWAAMVASYSGERGIFSRAAATNKAKENGRRDPNFEFGTNPLAN